MSYTPITPGAANWDVPINAALTSLDGQAQANANAISSLNTSTSTLTGQVSANTAAIAVNSGNISTLNGQVSTLNSTVATNSTNITTLQGQTSTNTTNIATGAANTAALATRATNLESGTWTPSQSGWLTWTYDPALTAGSTSLVTGQMFMARLDLKAAATVSAIYYAINTAGSTLTAGQNLVGFYDSTGTLLATSADQSGSWTSVGFKTFTLGSPYSAAAGTYYVGFLSNGTTPAGILRALGSGTQGAVVNPGLTASNARWATTGAGLTTVPASVTMSGRTLSGGTLWVALG